VKLTASLSLPAAIGAARARLLCWLLARGDGYPGGGCRTRKRRSVR